MDYSAWGVSWLGSWGNSWGPLHEVEENLVPAGHWKHLFRPIREAKTPEVKASVTTRASVVAPTTSRVLRVSADTPFVAVVCRTAATALDPFVGVSTPNLVAKTTTRLRVKSPSAGGIAPFLRGYGWTVTGKVASPSCGCGTPSVIGKGYGDGYSVKPHTIRNPTMEEIVMMF